MGLGKIKMSCNMNKIIAGHELLPGTIIKDYIPVEGTDLLIPCDILCGEMPGPTVLISAGIHNAEYIGIQAAVELSSELDTASLRGNVVILPLSNRSGFENRTMSMVYEDGKNLNRAFPGDRNGSMADRLAYMIFHNFIKKADAYIDLHSGDGYENLIPYVYYLCGVPAEEASRRMAACVDAQYCVRSVSRTGLAYSLASVNGIPSVLIERGQLGLVIRQEIEADKADVINILKCLGVLDGEYKTWPKQELSAHSVYAPCTGCWYPALEAGSQFREGDRLGEIRDYFGDILHTEYASADGILLYQCASLNIIKNDPMITFGIPAGQKA